MSSKKNLFEDDDNDVPIEEGDNFNVNKAYATKFEQVKRKQELQKLSSKYGQVDDDDEDDTEEDDDAVMLNAASERQFADLVRRLRANDPTLKELKGSFFREENEDGEDSSDDDDNDDERPVKPSGKAFKLKDEFQRSVVAAADGKVAGAVDDDDEHSRRRKARTKEEKAARAAFLETAAKQNDADNAEFTVKKVELGAAEDSQNLKRKKNAGKKHLEAAFAGAVDADDNFLAKYFANEGWRLENEPQYSWEQEAADDQDEQFYDEAEQWEREFESRKFHHEDGAEALKIQAFPRQQEGLLRQKDTSRKEARERKEEREKEAKFKADEELKRLKNLKRDEIRAFQRKIAQVAGLGSKRKSAKSGAAAAAAAEEEDIDAEEARIAALLTRAALEEEYDPEKFDKQMAALFDDSYYNEVNDDEFDVMAAEDDLIGSDDDELEDDELTGGMVTTHQEEADAKKRRLQAARAVKAKSKAIEADLPEALRGVDSELLYPTRALDKAVRSGGAPADGVADDDEDDVDPETLQKQLDAKVDEYWKLHYSGGPGGMRTRFKYREVNPETFGLTEDEIFTMDDRQLNMIAPLTAYATYSTKAQNVKDRFRSMHRRKTLRLLPSSRTSRRYKKDTVVFDPEAIDEETGRKIARRIRKRVAGDDATLEEDLANAEKDTEDREKQFAEARATKQQQHQKGSAEQRPPRDANAKARPAQHDESGAKKRPQSDGAPHDATAPPARRPPRPEHQGQQQQRGGGRPPRPDRSSA